MRPLAISPISWAGTYRTAPMTAAAATNARTFRLKIFRFMIMTPVFPGPLQALLQCNACFHPGIIRRYT